jgi:hypothetical protein
MKTNHPSLIQNNRGNTILMSLLVMTASVMGIYFASDKLLSERKLNLELKKKIGVNLSLRSVTDYVIYGIRKGWCFDSTLLPDSAESCAGSFTHPRSTWRLLMPSSYEIQLRELSDKFPNLFPPVPADDLHLKSFDLKIESKNFSPAHPLFKIISTLNKSVFKYITVKVERLVDINLPVNGDEVYIKVTVEFLDENSMPIQDGPIYFREVTRFVSVPREVNSFGLILAGNLYLAPPDATTQNAGHGVIPVGAKSDKGLNFESPIFVNGNIYLNKNAYAPVTFHDIVVLGNGAIRDSTGAPFIYGSPLGYKKYWSETSLFGGFLKGFESDGKRDGGLDVLSGITPSREIRNDIIKKCIELIRAESRLDLTDNSVLTARRLTGDTPQSFTNLYSFSKSLSEAQNVFRPQKLTTIPSHEGYDKRILIVSSGIDTSAHQVALWLEMKWIGENFRVPLFETGQGVGLGYEISFSPYTQIEINQALNTKNAAEQNRDKEKNEYDAILAAEPAPTGTAEHTAWLNSKNAAKAELDEAQLQFDNLSADYYKKKDFFVNPASIKISTLQPKLGFNDPQSPFREISVELKNAERFVKPKDNFRQGPYEMAPPDYMSFEGMDLSAYQGVVTRKDQPDDFNIVFHKFSTSANTVSVSNVLYKRDLTTKIEAPPADEIQDYESFKELCYSGTASGGGNNLDSFAPAGWNANFTDVSSNSWHWVPNDPNPNPDPDCGSQYSCEDITQNSDEFRIRATRSKCTIASTAKFVSGFWVCQKLIIEDRSEPLEIVGTFVVSRDLVIHPNALKAGITWSNIHNQISVRSLKEKSILTRADNSSCDTLPVPYWHPAPGFGILVDRLRCSPAYLFQGKNPPRWTSIDPDCGREKPTDANTVCMKRIRNFNLIQIERTYGPKE